MKYSTKIFTLFLCSMLLALSTQAQIFENTYTWGAFNHSAWKIQPNSPQGYVIAGNKFFESANTAVYMTGLDEFGQAQWTRTHESGHSLQTMWKSLVVSSSPIKYFVVLTGIQGGSNRAYALLTNATGQKFWDRSSAVPAGTQFGGVTNASNGGWVATGSSDNGNIIAAKFDAYGVLEWVKEYPVSGFGWTIAQTVGGVGYVMVGTRQVVRIDHLGNFQGSTNINLGNSPAPDGSAYSYSEFEEITPLPNGQGFIVTGSAFSNSFSGVYTARLSYAGSVSWVKINDAVNTTGAGTPVAWINNAIITGGSEIVTSWRRGPVSTGGAMFYQRMNFAGNNIGTMRSLNNVIPVQEAFMLNSHGKIIIGGTRGGYGAAYSYANAVLPVTGDDDADSRTEPYAELNPLTRIQTSVHNSQPVFEYPTTSRVFASELRVFPNPATGVINVGGALEPGALLRVVSLSGAVVLEREIQPNETMLQLDLTAVGKGMYAVEMLGKSGITTRKVVVE
ncbi:MAG: T9SS type A sorting domain-containing protein [Saprospiraceae bacterium]|nr:T9SS type A sorting domain-containing protein [Saprospiraceae bacterium]